jgi:hypothetical protein
LFGLLGLLGGLLGGGCVTTQAGWTAGLGALIVAGRGGVVVLCRKLVGHDVGFGRDGEVRGLVVRAALGGRSVRGSVRGSVTGSPTEPAIWRRLGLSGVGGVGGVGGDLRSIGAWLGCAELTSLGVFSVRAGLPEPAAWGWLAVRDDDGDVDGVGFERGRAAGWVGAGEAGGGGGGGCRGGGGGEVAAGIRVLRLGAGGGDHGVVLPGKLLLHFIQQLLAVHKTCRHKYTTSR